MTGAGWLFALLLAPAASPPPGLDGPRLSRGLELVYRGEVAEGSDRVGNRFRKASDLEVRVLVLEVGPAGAECAVQTWVRPRLDPHVAGPAVAVTGTDLARAEAAVRLEFVRVDPRGRCRLLRPAFGPPPIPLGPRTPTADPAPIPLDGPPEFELGCFVPLPDRAVALGDSWDLAEPGLPPVGWRSAEATWNGARCVEFTAVQQTDGWDRPEVAPAGWRRTETVLAAEGFAACVRRRVERREGAEPVGWVEVSYELRPPTRLIGTRYDEARREAEVAWSFAAEIDREAGRGGKPDPRPIAALNARVERYLRETPRTTGFREAVEGARRRGRAAARGDLPPTIIPAAAVAPAEPAVEGRPAPDFVAPALGDSGPFRLSAFRGSPVVLAFVKPGSATTRPALLVAQGLQRHFGAQAVVAAVAVGGEPGAADTLRGDMGLTLHVLDGDGLRGLYGVESFPAFVAVDPAGVIAWRFDGIGLETGFLARRAVEGLVAQPPSLPDR